MPVEKADPDHNLYERDGVWYVRYKLGGASHRESLSTSDVKKARKERDRILKAVLARRDGRVIEAEKTWAEAVEGYLVHQEGRVQAGELAQAAATRYATSVVQITLALGWQPDQDASQPSIPLSSITRATVTDYVDARREEERSTSTILNDLTAWSLVMAYAERKEWVESNPLRLIDRRALVGRRHQDIRPPTDAEVAALIAEVSGWSENVARLFRWLRETGMRLAEALNLRVEDIHPDGRHATLSQGVKRNRDGRGGMTRTIDLGPTAAAMIADLSKKGRLFGALPADSAVVSTRYGQWRRQRRARECKAAEAAGREPVIPPEFRIHDLRHSFAVASLVDDDTCIYRLSEHLGHTQVSTTEIYSGHLRRDGAMWRHSRDPALFGSLPPREG